MEKIININFQSRVIAIEESAYDALKQYTESLRRHFANEESSEEIITDIENRIAELLTGRLKQGAPCINITDLNGVIDSIGRIEDIKAAEGEEEPQPSTSTSSTAQPIPPVFNDRFYRNADDKVIAGICSGIAIRMNLDTAIVRVLFVLLFGALFWIYLLLWIIVPSRSISTNITRRLFRNPDDKVIAGVCGGLAVYFRTEAWKMRLLFLAPLILGGVFHRAHLLFWHWGHMPGFFVGSFGSSFFILYVILWIATPFASTATDRMEMRGEKIDINSIKAATQARSGAAPYPARPAVSSIGRVIGILFKAFFLFIGGSVALALFAALIAIVFAGTVTMPFSGFVLDGWNQYALTWTGLALTLGIPLLALAVWLVRGIMGVHTPRHYLAYVFAVLWFTGIVCSLIMAGIITGNFSSKSLVEQQLPIQQPSAGRIYINVSNAQSPWHSSRYSRWFGDWDEQDDAPFHIVSKDSLWLNTVKVNIEQSPDSLFHIFEIKSSRANTSQEAKQFAEHIAFDVTQQDSVITLPRGFTISSKDKFRNQQVLMTIEVPLGKNVQVSQDVNGYSWFTVNTNHRGIHYRRHWTSGRNRYGTEKEYIMTASGLKRQNDTASGKNEDNDDDDDE